MKMLQSNQLNIVKNIPRRSAQITRRSTMMLKAFGIKKKRTGNPLKLDNGQRKKDYQ